MTDSDIKEIKTLLRLILNRLPENKPAMDIDPARIGKLLAEGERKEARILLQVNK